MAITPKKLAPRNMPMEFLVAACVAFAICGIVKASFLLFDYKSPVNSRFGGCLGEFLEILCLFAIGFVIGLLAVTVLRKYDTIVENEFLLEEIKRQTNTVPLNNDQQ